MSLIRYKMIFICLLVAQITLAQEYKHEVQGTIVDKFTGIGLTPRVSLLRSDSTMIDTTTAVIDDYYASMGISVGYYSFPGVIQKGKYIVKATLKGYEDAYMDFELRSNREGGIFVNRIFMSKIHELNEVVVKASKIKMVMRGDTIVYNADAFKLPEGSMLDALVARLPGTKLTQDGRIYVNGKFVEALLVNGHDFFSGSPKLALENLPSYTVSKIKVYNKAGDASKIMGRDMNDKSFTMDVKLKKEYSTGYMGNLEVGIGTQSRYTARGLGIKFSEKERIGTYFNMNNLNDNQRAKLDGEWNPQDQTDGLTSTKNAGLSYIRFLKGYDSWVESNVNWEHTNADNTIKTQTQTYLYNGDAFKNTALNALYKRDYLNTHNLLKFSSGRNFSINTFDLSYTKKHGWTNIYQTEVTKGSLLSTLMENSNDEAKNLNIQVGSNNGIKSIADLIRLDASVTYNRNTLRSLERTDIVYHQASIPQDQRINYTEAPNQNLKFIGSVAYDYLLRNITIRPIYQYTYMFNKAQNLLYRIDQLESGTYDLDNLLPSVASELYRVIDSQNSFQYREHRYEHKLALYFNKQQSKFFGSEITINLPIRWIQSRFNYERSGNHDICRRNFFLEPNVTIKKSDKWSLMAGIESDFPDMTLLADYRDDHNPLMIQLGNRNLKNIHKYRVDGRVAFRGTHQQAFNLHLGYHQTDNAVALSLLYDNQTSISTLQPVNVNGNWDVTGGIGYTRTLDKKGKLSLDNQLGLTYKNSVDMASTIESRECERSIVYNTILRDNVKLNYRFGENYELTLHGDVQLFNIQSHRAGFEATHAGNYNIGLNTQLILPLNIKLATDITMFMRRGYQVQEMNSTDWIWNAQLSKAFVKEKLLAKLVMFDLFHQLKTTKYTMNEQGRTETWHNNIPRYVMFTLAWKFNVNPKKHNESK